MRSRRPGQSPGDFLAVNRQVQAAADPLAAGLIDAMKGQLLIVLVERLGGEVRVPVAEVDDTGGKLLGMAIEGADFIFKVTRKQ